MRVCKTAVVAAGTESGGDTMAQDRQQQERRECQSVGQHIRRAHMQGQHFLEQASGASRTFNP